MKEMQLTKGRVALVDDEDYDWLSKWKWTYANTGYAKRQSKGKTYLMHREIIKTRKYEIDHINRDRLDNRRNNLRKCTRSQNKQNTAPSMKNTSGYKGVYHERKTGRWYSQIKIPDGKVKHIGTFETKELAYQAYQEASSRYFGKFAYKE